MIDPREEIMIKALTSKSSTLKYKFSGTYKLLTCLRNFSVSVAKRFFKFGGLGILFLGGFAALFASVFYIVRRTGEWLMSLGVPEFVAFLCLAFFAIIAIVSIADTLMNRDW